MLINLKNNNLIQNNNINNNNINNNLIKKNQENFNIGDIVSVFLIREENIEEELYFIGLVTTKNLKHATFKICCHTQIEMNFSFFSPFIIKINLLKKQALNLLQFKKKKKKKEKILKKKKTTKNINILTIIITKF